MEGAPRTSADLQIDIKQEPTSTDCVKQAKAAHTSKRNIPFEPAKKYKRSEIHDKYGGKNKNRLIIFSEL